MQGSRAAVAHLEALSLEGLVARSRGAEHGSTYGIGVERHLTHSAGIDYEDPVRDREYLLKFGGIEHNRYTMCTGIDQSLANVLCCPHVEAAGRVLYHDCRRRTREFSR